jgi:uncharacterized repeat protein (TIGR03833 family)
MNDSTNTNNSTNGNTRSAIRPGLKVEVILKEDQRSGKRTPGVVKDILTKSPTHPHGIKVRLESGLVGRVAAILPG